MKKIHYGLTCIFLVAFIFQVSDISCQEISDDYVTPPIRLSGPRIGITVLTGSIAEELRDSYDAIPVITQFGWQFETRFYTLENGSSGLIEGVMLIGGLEQGLFLPSMSGIIGFRSQSGAEFGLGPNISITGFGVVIAAGITVKSENINFPINLALLPSRDGFRFSLLVGFNVRRK